jgi:KDO2-lipid IV(A) lauroyltransferase
MSKAVSEGRAMAFLIRLLGRLPLPVLAGLGGFLGWLVAVTPIRFASARRLVLINLLVCYPFLSWHECRRMARRSLVETGRSLAEFAHAWTRPAEQSLRRITAIHGLETYQKALESDRPVLVLSLHQSSWELVGLYLGTLAPTRILYQPDKKRAVNELVRAGREQTGCRLFPVNNEGIKASLGVMRQGGVLAMLADHNPGMSSNPLIPFFGHKVPTPALIAKLVSRHQPHVFFASCYRGHGPNDVRIYLDHAVDVEQGETEESILLAVNRGLEAVINRSPVQYQWTYKRFKTGENGNRGWYRQSRKILDKAKRGQDREALGLMSPTAPRHIQGRH